MKAIFTHFRTTMAAVCVIGWCTIGNAQRQNLIFEATFEPTNSVSSFVSPNSFTNFSNAEKCCSYSITRVSDITRNGGWAAKFDIRRADPLGDRHRAELVMTNEPDCRQERWYGLSVYLPADFISDPEPESIFQWHEVPDVNLGENWLPSPLQVTIQNNRYDCSIIWDANPVTVAPNWGSAHVDMGSVTPDKGKWTDWVFHIKWAYDNSGILEVWKDGVKVVSRINAPNTFNDQEGTYFKLGLHKWTWIGSTQTTTSQRVMYADELRIGNANATYNDVAPTASTTPPPPVNQLPTANAGNDITLTLPANSTTLNGTGNDPDGTVTYAWTRVSGPTTFTMGTPNAASTTLTNLVQGTYVFRLTVTDNNNATATDNVMVTVNPVPNQPPTANAGNDITLTLPINNTTLNGSGTDADGTISYAWTRVSGPTTFTLGTPNAASTTLTNLVQGTYVFRLTVTDNNNATATDNVTVTVNPAPNQLPTANAGNDITLTLPINNTTLNGSGTDADGTISYAWTRVSGPTTFTMGTPNTATTTLTNLVQGTYVFRLTVTDNSNATATDNVTVTVNPAPNQLPTANAGNDITLTLPVNNTTLNGSGTDADGTISYAWAYVSGPTTFTLGNANAASSTLTNLVQGTYVFRLTVTDNNNATATDNITVVVNPAPNQPPVANAGNDITINLPTDNTTLNGTGNDPDGTVSAYSWSRVSGPTTFNLGNANAASSPLTNLAEGTYVFRLTVTDDDNATDTDDITVIVNAATAPPPNQTPTAAAGNDITITLPTNNTTLNGSGTDADGTVSFAWTRVSGPTTFTLGTANAATSTLSNLVQGTYVFRLTVTDNNNATATDDIRVIVNAAPPPPNQAPTANAGNDIAITLPTNNTTLNGSGMDADGTVSFAWTRVSGPTTFALGTSNAATSTLSNLVQGVYVFRLTVTDNNNATATDDVTVTVNAAPPPPNQTPTANAGNDITITLPTNNTTLNGSGTDADGTISFAWTRVSGPTTFTLGTANGATSTLSNLVQGVYVFRLTVTDNNNATATDEVTVTVNAAPPPPNQAPTANAGNDITITLPTNNTTLNGSGTDADGTVSFAWTRVSGPTTFTLGTANAATSTLSNLVQGVYVFRLTVTDNNNATATDEVTVTVNAATPPPNQAPTANAGNDITITLPTNNTTLNGNGTDADGTVSFAWTRVSGPTTFTLGTANAATSTLTNLVQGTYVFRLTVTDNNNATATDDVTVIVNAAPPPPNQAPTVNAGNDITITLPTNSTTLSGSANDPDGNIASYSWSRVSGPVNFAMSSSNASATTVTGLVEGVYVFRLTVTDNNGASTGDNVTVTVVRPPNQLPIANAGQNQAATLTSNAAALNGMASYDPDGTIVAYQWEQVSGPSVSTLSSTSTASINVSNLVPGDYVYRLTVTDNSNATASVNVTVAVVDNFRNFAGQALYPNPATTSVNIVLKNQKSGTVTVRIFDLGGQKVMADIRIDKPSGYYTFPIDISGLRPGTYMIETTMGKFTRMISKFVKQ